MKKTRFAVVSTDGKNVNDHFGKAERFLIFDWDGQPRLVETRSAEPLSVGDLNHAFDADKFNRVASVLKDCSQVYVTRIGDTPAAKLTSLGIVPVTFNGAIDDIKL